LSQRDADERKAEEIKEETPKNIRRRYAKNRIIKHRQNALFSRSDFAVRKLLSDLYRQARNAQIASE